MEKLLSIKEVAELLSVHPRTVNRMINRGELPAVKVGNRWRIKPEDVERKKHRGSDNMYQVLDVSAIPESDGRGCEVDLLKTTDWRKEKIDSIVEQTMAIDNVGLVRLLDCAKAFAKKSEQDRAVNAKIKDKGGRDQLTAGDIIEISEELNLFPAEVDHYFFQGKR